MDFEYSQKVEGLRSRVQDFMSRYVLPANLEVAPQRRGRAVSAADRR